MEAEMVPLPRSLARRQPELRDKLSAPELRRLLDRAPDVVYRCRGRPTPRFDYVSSAIGRITGYTPKQLYNQPSMVLQLVHPDDRTLMRTMLARGSSGVPVILRWLRKDGSVVWIEQRNTSVRDDAGELFAI